VLGKFNFFRQKEKTVTALDWVGVAVLLMISDDFDF